MVFGLSLTAITVKKKMKKDNHIIKKVKNTTVIESVKKSMLKLYHLQNKTIIGVLEKKERVSKFTIEDMLLPTKKELHTLKQDGTHEKEMQKVRIPLKSGKTYVKNLITNVRTVEKLKNLQKTTLNHFQKKVATTYQTFNHYAGIVTAESGKLTFILTQNY